jgi:fibronectin-binding autotransporter adhesin
MQGGTVAGVGGAFSNGTITIDAAATAVTLATSETATDVFTLGNAANDLTGGTAATVIGIGGAGAVPLAVASNFAGSWNVPAGSRLELANVNSLGATTTSNVTLAGGTLAPRINTGTSFVTSQGNNIILSASSTILSDRSSASTPVTHTFGSLSMGTHTLSVSPGPNATASATPGGIVVGNVTLTGNPTFAVADTVAPGKLTTGSLLGGGSRARS